LAGWPAADGSRSIALDRSSAVQELPSIAQALIRTGSAAAITPIRRLEIMFSSLAREGTGQLHGPHDL
jgi:hypothetical protein